MNLGSKKSTKKVTKMRRHKNFATKNEHIQNFRISKKTDAKKVLTKILGFRKKHEIVNPGGLPEMRRHEK